MADPEDPQTQEQEAMRRNRKTPLAILLLLALLGIRGTAQAAEDVRLSGDVSAASTDGAKSLRIAALPFRNSSAKAEFTPIAEGLGDFLVACAHGAKRVAFVERAELQRILDEQKLSLAALQDDQTRTRLGRLLTADYLLTGSMTVVDGDIRINAHLFEVETSRVVNSDESAGKITELIETVQPLAASLMKDIGVALPPLDPARVDQSPVANLHFMRGLGYYYGNMRNHAIAEFMKALACKPDHARARYWSGRCYLDGREWDHAAIEYGRFLKEFPKDDLAAQAARELAACRQRMKAKKGIE